MPWLGPLGAQLGIRHVFTLSERGDGTLTQAARPQSYFETVARRATTSRRSCTRRDDRALEGRDAHAPQPRLERARAAPGWGFRPDDVLIHMLPLFHVHGLFVASHCVLLNGTAMRFHAQFDARQAHRGIPDRPPCSWACRRSTRASSPSPARPQRLRADMRLFVSGSAPLLAETHVEFEATTGVASSSATA
jgi:malonyl-CoA/methylmalonyl-CoA synthetase